MISSYVFFFVVVVLLNSAKADKNEAITPKKYATIIKQGFATNYFKSLETEEKYNDKNIDDVYDLKFRNLRLRSRADLYKPPYDGKDFQKFLDNLEKVVDKCLDKGVAPIISWINHHAEAKATEQEKNYYIKWWTLVAQKLKNKGYNLSFNLFTELGIDACGDDCSQSLRENTKKYNEWTKAVVNAIRKTGGKNSKRILILASPKKTAKGLHLIDESILKDDKYLMAEFHLYASGPNKIKGSAKYWDGRKTGKDNVKESLKPALEWSKKHGIPTYFGAWMPQDNTKMALDKNEIKKFARYFVNTLKKEGIPWSLNVLDRYYDTKLSKWLDEDQTIKGKKLNFKPILDAIVDEM